MKFYLAPMEGITGYVYRNAVAEYYGSGIDKYFSPFITYHTKRILNDHELRDIIPEHNKGIKLIPQILTNRAEEFLSISEYLNMKFGYTEFDLNLGCPSGTVVSKGRGAGFLAKTDELRAFLDEIYSRTDFSVSVKTRIGMTDVSEFQEIMKIYSDYPLSELIIHPRVRKEMYNGMPHTEVFREALAKAGFPLCYNGNIYTAGDYGSITAKMADNEHFAAVMCGRGMISHPYLLSQLSGMSDNGCVNDVHRLQAFHDCVVEGYTDEFKGDMYFVLRKMKEIWTYMIAEFPDCTRQFKELCKSQNMNAYRAAVEVIFSSRY